MKIFEENAEELHIDEEDYQDPEEGIVNLGFLMYILIERKSIDFSLANPNSKFSEKIDSEKQDEVIGFTDKLIAKDKFASKLYSSLNVEETEEGLTYTSDIPGLITFVMNRTPLDEQLDLHNINKMELKSILINLCIAFESLLSQILNEYFLHSPNPNIAYNKTITYGELLEMEDVSSAKKHLISQQIEDLFRKKFEVWIEEVIKMFSAEKIKSMIEDEVESISEMYQRRNLFVHNNGIVNDQYLKNTKKTNLKKDDVIDINIKYVKERIKDLKFVSWLLFDSYLKRHYQSSGDAFSKMNGLLLEYIDEECHAVPQIFEKYSKNTNIDEEAKKIAKVNYFLYYKLNGGLENFQEKVLDFPTNHLSEDFKMSKAILLEEENYLDKIQEYIDNLDESTFFETFDWPILKAAKDKDKIANILNNRLRIILEE